MLDSSIDSLWQLTCRAAKNHATVTASRCRREAAKLIRAEAAKFCGREPPASSEELSLRQEQAIYLTSKIGMIAHADLMGRNHPAVSDRIMSAATAFVNGLDVDDSPSESAQELMSTISTLCQPNPMQHI